MKKLWFMVLLLAMAGMLMAAQYDYTPSNSPTADSYDSNTLTESNWTTINVTQSDVLSSVSITYTWDTDYFAEEGSFKLKSPNGTTVTIASEQADGTYTINKNDFNGESMNGNWDLWIEDSYGDGGHQATNITVSFFYTPAGAPIPASNPIPANASNNVPVNGTIEWTWGADTSTYDLMFGPTGNMVQVVTDGVASGTTGSYTYSGLTNNTNYSWQVISKGNGQTSNGPVWTFTSALPEGLLQIGSGTLTTLNLPLNPNYGYNYSQTLYLQSEINTADKQISKLYYYWNGLGAGVNTKDWVVYMGHTNKTAFSTTTDWIPLSNLTQVYNGIVTLPATAGWVEIVLNLPFIYNNTDNLVIAVDENTPSYDGFSLKFFGTSFPTNRGIRYQSDSTNPNTSAPPTGTLVAGIANIRIQLDDVPANAIFSVNPTEKDFGTKIINTTSDNLFTITNIGGGNLGINNISITGDAAFTLTEMPLSFPVSLGTAQNTTFKVQYAPTSAGNHTATVTIVDNLSKTNHTINVQGICVDPTIVNFPYNENFDTLTVPNLPLGWASIVNSTSGYVNTYNYSYNSSPNVLRLANSSDASAILIASTPIVQNINSKRVKFYAKNGAYPLIVGTLSDQNDANSFTEIQTITITSSYVQYTVSLETATGNHIAFKHGLGGTYRTIYIDDVLIEEIPTQPIYTVTPTSKNFGDVEMNTESAAQTFTITNTGAGTLVLPSAPVIEGTNPNQFILTDTNTYPLYLTANASATLQVKFAPTSEGAKSAVLNIAYNDGTLQTSTITLSGTGLNPVISSFPHTQTFSAASPLFWTRMTGLLQENPTLTPYTGVWNSYTQWSIGNFANTVNANGTGARVNLYSTNQHWLVTPEINLGNVPGGYKLSFDMALTSFSGTTPALTGTDDKFAVLISTDNGTTWSPANVLKLWDNTGSPNVLNEVSNVGENHIINLIGYTGSVKIAFYGESTESNADNYLHIDNVTITYDATLPVELSSFNTAVLANNTVSLTWVTQSENNLFGYHLYRGTENQIATADRITSAMIAPANTSTETTYSFTDSEVTAATTYYYWLQSVESNGTSEYFGPYTVRTNDATTTPTLPSVTAMRNAYPNPFNGTTHANFDVDVKDGETAQLTIYNIKGQVVKTYSNIIPGNHKFMWNGKDANNNRCAAGIYFYKLSSPTFSSTKKMMYLK